MSPPGLKQAILAFGVSWKGRGNPLPLMLVGVKIQNLSLDAFIMHKNKPRYKKMSFLGLKQGILSFGVSQGGVTPHPLTLVGASIQNLGCDIFNLTKTKLTCQKSAS